MMCELGMTKAPTATVGLPPMGMRDLRSVSTTL